MVVDNEADLAGLPDSSIAQAAEEAQAAGLEGKWVFTLRAPSRLPFLTYADNRALREKMYKGYINLANNGNENDNKALIATILRLRKEKANLFGFKTYADYQTDNGKDGESRRESVDEDLETGCQEVARGNRRHAGLCKQPRR